MPHRYKFAVWIFIGCSLLTPVSHAGWQDLWKPLESTIGTMTGQGEGAQTSLTQQEMSQGLKQALDVGIRRAIDLLGRNGGFLDDPQVRIPLPRSLQTVEKGLRAVGQDRLADDFIATMNHAAERAVPETATIFADAIKGMTLQDAKGILQGSDDAATQYLKTHSSGQLETAIFPIVKEATARSGVTSAYKRLIGNAGFAGGFLDTSSLDLDRYVTDKTLDGLFVKLAEEEKRIREDPVARSTELLQKVFGSGSP